MTSPVSALTLLSTAALLALAACGADPGASGSGGRAGGTGGSASGSGGAPGSGSGGALGSGGAPGSGGATTSGGAPGSGGAIGSGGTPASGGSGAGGAAGSGGAATGGSGRGGGGGGMASGSGGGAGRSGSGGAGAGGGTAGGDLLPPRPMNVTATKGRHQHMFRAKTADAAVSFNDNNEIAVFDNRAATLMGKLVLPFDGVGQNAGSLTGAGEFCAKRGYHVLAIAAFQDYDILSHGADFFGQARRTVFEGVMYTREGEFASIQMTPADGVAQRTQKALQYLHAMFPDEDWGYYLQSDGSVRWSDVIFTGFSHGASNAARFGFLVRASRVVSSAGPRENLCSRVDLANCGGVVATWLSEMPKTPIDRFFTITGRSDDQHTQHLFAMEKLGYTGKATAIDGAQPPYGNTHRLTANSGHTDFCGQASFAAACNYVFGVPIENQAGTQ